ncbi:MAG: hypothetical protein QOF17_810 [Solirubrobacteraceae bacterium]|jgi:hypothetical protein|nr:hypothetical protein [Solirubrobacteraceae bacterium]
MFYKLLGMAVWNGAKWYLGRRFGPRAGAKALAAGGVVAVAVGVGVLLVRRSGSDA